MLVTKQSKTALLHGPMVWLEAADRQKNLPAIAHNENTALTTAPQDRRVAARLQGSAVKCSLLKIIPVPIKPKNNMFFVHRYLWQVVGGTVDPICFTQNFEQLLTKDLW